MTIRDAFAEIQGMLQSFAPENMYPVAARHLKHATQAFAMTPALAQTMTVLPTGVADYTLSARRISRIYHIEHANNGRTWQPRIVEPAELSAEFPDPTTTGSEVRYATFFGRTVRLAPLVTGGTVTLWCSVVPVSTLRDTPRNKTETATAGSTTTAVASTITHGLVNNRSGATDYFDGCRIVFDSGSALTSQYSYITGTNEGASSITFTFSPAVSTAVTTETFHIEDSLEVPEQYAVACVDYAAGMIAALDSKAGALASRLLQSYDAVLAEAKAKPFGWQPGAKFRVGDYMERAGNRVWVS